MKKHILIAFFVALITNAYSQTDKPIAGIPPYRTLQQTIGESFVLLPLDSASYKEYRTKNSNSVRLAKGNEGKTLKLISLNEHESTALLQDSSSAAYTAQIELDNLAEFIPLIDLQAAQKLINKTVWLNVTEIKAGKPTKKYTFDVLSGIRFEPVKIVNIGLASNDSFPLQITVKTANGQYGFVITYLSGTNTNRKENFSFSHYFLSENPQLKYHFTPAVWKMVKAGYTEIGMPIDAFVLVMGYPDRINNTQTAKGTTQQYVYGSSYYYFAGGKLTAKQY